MTTQRHIDALRTVLRQIRARLAMLESVAPLNSEIASCAGASLRSRSRRQWFWRG